MPIIYDGQLNNYYATMNTKKKKLAFYTIYTGGAWRDFGNNVILGNGIQLKPEFQAKMKTEQKQKEIKEQETLDKIVKKTRTKEDIVSGGGFKIC